jgi:UDP-N-acetylmuramate--alanine ligase
MTHYHFIGIGGTGLSAIARVLFERGEIVSGSDISMTPVTHELHQLGVPIFIGHDRSNIQGADIVIRSSAVQDINPEVVASIANGIPVLKRRDFLKHLTKGYKVIAVAGTHGKTTTTAMAAWCLSQSGFNPSYVIGSVSKNLGKNAAAGSGEYFVIEADEYDNMFLGLSPQILIITNIEHDHPDCFPTETIYRQAFRDLTGQLLPGGYLIACIDNEGVRALIQDLSDSVNVITYGKNQAADLQIQKTEYQAGGKMSFILINNTNLSSLPVTTEYTLGIPGYHNALNAAAVIATTMLIGVNAGNVPLSLASFSGSERRFDILGEVNGITVIDDYGHHPTEIKATLSAARERYKDNNIWAVWQPHTYSRTQELAEDFIHSFSDCDHVIITEIYRSREPQQEYSSQILVNAMEHPDKYYRATLDETEALLREKLCAGDLLIVFSAGDANQITQNIIEYLRFQEEKND